MEAAQGIVEAVWRDNLSEKRAAIRMVSCSRGEEMIVARRRERKSFLIVVPRQSG